MQRIWNVAGMGAGIGMVLGAVQVVRDNAASWNAVHATAPTVAVQILAGALIGGLFVGAVTFYWMWRRLPRRGHGRRTDASVPVRDPGASPRPARTAYGPRHVLIFLFSAGLIGVGLSILFAALRHPTFYGVVRGGGGALVLLAMGVYLLWDDFVAPHTGSGRRATRVTDDAE